ncbi:MAG: hypothetical protein Q7O66_06040 [Dehalococcoidia bacterium]|nr:hypothetical protein [Dehalococcoidia bacterium]
MSRVDELQKKYPTIPRSLIIHRDIHSHGVKPTQVLAGLSTYDRSVIYQSRDNEVTLEDITKQNPGSARPGFVAQTPMPFLKDGFGLRIIRDPRSNYEFREEGPDKYGLYEGEEKVDDLYFPKSKDWSDDPDREPRTSAGTPVTSLVRMKRRCWQIVPVRFCEYFTTGDECKFCNLNATYDDAASAFGVRHAKTINLDDTVEAFKIIASSMPPLIEGRLVMGGFSDSDKEMKVHLGFIEQLAKATSYMPNHGISTQPPTRATLQRLKDAGISTINMNMEVWDRRLFEEICPGKASYRGYDHYLETFQDAVEVFGWGSVGTNLIGGVTLLPIDGHRTWQEARDSTIEGVQWLIKHGVLPFIETIVLGAGSPYGNDQAGNRPKLPPTDLFLDVAMAHHQACKEYGMYERMNRLLWCPLDCAHAGYVGQLGMVEVAGDIGKWAATCVPEDGNWIGRFIESFKAPAKTLQS